MADELILPRDSLTLYSHGVGKDGHDQLCDRQKCLRLSYSPDPLTEFSAHVHLEDECEIGAALIEFRRQIELALNL